jgi:hypothetical protein
MLQLWNTVSAFIWCQWKWKARPSGPSSCGLYKGSVTSFVRVPFAVQPTQSQCKLYLPGPGRATEDGSEKNSWPQRVHTATMVIVTSEWPWRPRGNTPAWPVLLCPQCGTLKGIAPSYRCRLLQQEVRGTVTGVNWNISGRTGARGASDTWVSPGMFLRSCSAVDRGPWRRSLLAWGPLSLRSPWASLFSTILEQLPQVPASAHPLSCWSFQDSPVWDPSKACLPTIARPCFEWFLQRTELLASNNFNV